MPLSGMVKIAHPLPQTRLPKGLRGVRNRIGVCLPLEDLQLGRSGNLSGASRSFSRSLVPKTPSHRGT